MNKTLLLLVIIILIVLLSGVITSLESKILALTQLSISSSKLDVFGVNQFFYDFINLINNTISYPFIGNEFSSYFNMLVFIVTFLFNIIMVLFCLYFNKLSFSIILYILISAMFLSLVNISTIGMIKCYFNKELLVSLKVIFSIIEGIFYLIDIMFLTSNVFFGIEFYLTTDNDGFCFSINMLYPVLILVCLFKSFSAPYDYIESESESVNGLFLKSSSMEFAMWSLIEYLGVLYNSFYFMFLFFIINGFSFKFYFFLYYSFLLFMVLIISSFVLSNSLDEVLSSLLIWLFFIFLLFFLMIVFYFSFSLLF